MKPARCAEKTLRKCVPDGFAPQWSFVVERHFPDACAKRRKNDSMRARDSPLVLGVSMEPEKGKWRYETEEERFCAANDGEQSKETFTDKVGDAGELP
jgi:hypothetical protein